MDITNSACFQASGSILHVCEQNEHISAQLSTSSAQLEQTGVKRHQKGVKTSIHPSKNQASTWKSVQISEQK